MSLRAWSSSIGRNKIFVDFLGSPKVFIQGNDILDYYIEFKNRETGNTLFSQVAKTNELIECPMRYWVPWDIYINGDLFHSFELEGLTVLFIIGDCMNKGGLGDVLAWAPYVVDFCKRHNCKALFYSHFNELFLHYADLIDIEFIEPLPQLSNVSDFMQELQHDFHAGYNISWFRNTDLKSPGTIYIGNKIQPNLMPLQKTATTILGLASVENHYGVKFNDTGHPLNHEPYICIGPESTASMKEWPHEYWQELINHIHNYTNYSVQVLKRSADLWNFENCHHLIDLDLSSVCNYLYHAEYFIGLGSGLSWLNWSLDKHTYMINGFSKDCNEFQTNITRICNDICIKCWNDPIHLFDRHDRDFCPVYKGTRYQHICQKSITPEQVIKALGI